MKFCKGCGAQLSDDARFCTSCGDVVEGSNERKTDTSSQYANNQALSYLLEAKDIFLKMLVKPVSTVSYAVNNFRVQSALMLAGIIAVINGLLSMWLLGKVVSPFESIGDLYGGYGTPSLPYGSVFVSSIIFSLLCMGVISGVTYVVSKFFLKSQKGFVSMLNVAVCSQIPYVVSLVISIIVSYISIKLFLIILAIGIILAIIVTFEGIKEASSISGDLAALVTCIVYAVSSLIIYSYYVNSLFDRIHM